MLVSANGTDCRELAFSETVALLRESPRPLTLELVQLDALAKMDVVETEKTVHATFFADQSLGIELASEGDDVCVGRCEVGSAAALVGQTCRQHHSLIGMAIVSLAAGTLPEQRVTGLPLASLQGLLKMSQRPIRIGFEARVVLSAAERLVAAQQADEASVRASPPTAERRWDAAAVREAQQGEERELVRAMELEDEQQVRAQPSATGALAAEAAVRALHAAEEGEMRG